MNEMSEEECSGGNRRREMSARDDRIKEGVGIILGNVGRSRPCVVFVMRQKRAGP